MPPAPVPPVQVVRQEVDTFVLNGFPDSQRFRSRTLFVGCRVGGFVALWYRCPRSGSFSGLFPYLGFSSNVGQPCVTGVCVYEMKSSNPFIPTTARASSGPSMDIPSRRRRVGSPSARLDSVSGTPEVFPDHLLKSCRMVLPSSPCIPDSQAI